MLSWSVRSRRSALRAPPGPSTGRGAGALADWSREISRALLTCGPSQPSTSRSRITVRCMSGSMSIASRTSASVSRDSAACSGIVSQRGSGAAQWSGLRGRRGLEAVGVDGVESPSGLGVGERRERHRAPLAHAARLRAVDEDPEDPGLQRGAALEAIQALQHRSHVSWTTSSATAPLGVNCRARRSIDGPSSSTRRMNASLVAGTQSCDEPPVGLGLHARAGVDLAHAPSVTSRARRVTDRHDRDERSPSRPARELRRDARRAAPRRRARRLARARRRDRKRDRAGGDPRRLRHARAARRRPRSRRARRARRRRAGRRRPPRPAATHSPTRRALRRPRADDASDDAARDRSATRRASLAAFYAFADELLRTLHAEAPACARPRRSGCGPSTSTSPSSRAPRPTAARAGYGASPGDEHHPEPYLYVGPGASRRAARAGPRPASAAPSSATRRCRGGAIRAPLRSPSSATAARALLEPPGR